MASLQYSGDSLKSNCSFQPFRYGVLLQTGQRTAIYRHDGKRYYSKTSLPTMSSRKFSILLLLLLFSPIRPTTSLHLQPMNDIANRLIVNSLSFPFQNCHPSSRPHGILISFCDEVVFAEFFSKINCFFFLFFLKISLSESAKKAFCLN